MTQTNEQHTAPSLLRAVRLPFFFIILASALLWWITSSFFTFPENIFRMVQLVSEALVVLSIIWLMFVLIDVLTEYILHRTSLTGRKMDESLAGFIRITLKVFIALITIVVVVSNLGYNVTGLVAGLGIGGLAIALAAQESLSNLFGSMVIFTDRPFKQGDFVIIGDTRGIVEQVGFRSTRIRTYYNSLVIIPNGELMKTRIDNMGMRDYRRTKTRISVTYQTPPEKMEAFCAGIRELIRAHPFTRNDLFHVWFKEFGASSLEIELVVHMKVIDYETESRERHRLFLDIMRLAQCLGIEFAYPTQTIYMGKETGSTPVFPEVGEIRDKTNTEIDAALKIARKISKSAIGGEGIHPPPYTFVDGDLAPSDDEDETPNAGKT